jgi:hypothetical protein
MNEIQWPHAVISEDGRYRYYLSRSWSDVGLHVAFVGLNPSTADAVLDDPTIRRCVAFAKEWGGGRMSMVNLFALRSTDPQVLAGVADPVGPENEAWLDRVMPTADIAVACWGNHGVLHGRAAAVTQRFAGRLVALAVNKSGSPKHPLYVRGSTIPHPYGAPAD